ncbi:unnamed protein product [marine sediment metagenome]|uniref:BIG2 domain-containing protein n=1 Tax=marine sediment metagenome TaxID=412755 RepID=X1B494_9ZZZZ
MHNHRLHRKKFLILLIVLVGTLSLLPGCGGYPSPTPPISLTYLTRIVVQPNTMDLEVGESQYIISVTAYYSDSSTADIPLSNCTYFSYNSSCATVNSSGLTTGVSAGITIILVTYTEGTISKTDTVEVTVTQNEVVYRALCVGVGDYIWGSDNDLSAPPYDVDRMCYTFSKCRFGSSNTPFSNIWYLKDNFSKNLLFQKYFIFE